MSAWDFAADIEALLDQVERGEGPQSMSQMIQAAQTVVGATNAAELGKWLIENAAALIGQQILVASVHAQSSADTELSRILAGWAAQAAQPSPSSARNWLKEEHPALLRAWLLSRVEELLDAEMKDL